MAKRKLKKDIEDDRLYLYVSKKPSWINSDITRLAIDEKFHDIMDFYVTFCICPEYATQGRTLTFYKWKDKPWNTYNYLKKKLDWKDQNLICSKRKMKPLNEIKNELNEMFISGRNWYESTDEFAIFSKVESNEYLSIFYHIRCALAHGRFTIRNNEGNRFYYFENGVSNGNSFKVKARMCLKESTLCHWICVITNGPTSDENIEESIIRQIIMNSSVTIKAIKFKTGLSKYEIEKVISLLKDQIEMCYIRKEIGKPGYWKWNDSLLNKRFPKIYMNHMGDNI